MSDDLTQDRRDTAAIAAATARWDAQLKYITARNEAMYAQHELELGLADTRRMQERMEQEALDPTTAPVQGSQRVDQALTRPGYDGTNPADSTELQDYMQRLTEPGGTTFEEFCRNRTSLIADPNRRGLFS